MKALRCTAFGGERGSVLMEYMVMSCVMVSAIVVFWHTQLYDYQNGWKEGTPIPKLEKQLRLGRDLVEFYQRVLGGVALPVP